MQSSLYNIVNCYFIGAEVHQLVKAAGEYFTLEEIQRVSRNGKTHEAGL